MHAHGDTRGLRWISTQRLCSLLAFLMLVLGGTLFIQFVSERHNLYVAIAILLFVPALLLALPFAVRQVGRKLWALRKQLAWWHAVWLLVFCSALVYRTRESGAVTEEPVDAWAFFRITLVTTTAFILMARLALRLTPWVNSLFRGLVGALGVFALVSVSSTLWSIYPALTLYKSLEYLVDVALIAAILVSVRSPNAFKSLFDWTWTLYGFLVASVWLGALVWPGQALIRSVGLIGVQLYGVVPNIHANTVGECGAILAIVAFSRLLARSRGVRELAWNMLVLSASLATLVMSQTRSAIAGFMLGVLVVMVASKRCGVAAALVMSVILLLVTTDAASLFVAYSQRGQSPELLQSLSGRLPWWKLSWEKFLDQPLTGYGAYAGGRFAVLAELGQSEAASVHNSYLEIVLGTGILGLGPVLVALFGTWLILIRRLRTYSLSSFDRPFIVEALGVLTVVTVRSFFTSGLVWNHSIVFLLIVGYAELLRRRPMDGGTSAQYSVSPAGG